MCCMLVRLCVLYVSHTVYFTCCMLAILHMLHNSKKHVSQTSCSAHESVFLCAAHEIAALLCQITIKAYNEMACKQNMEKHGKTWDTNVGKCGTRRKQHSVKYLCTRIPTTLDGIVSHHLNTKHDNGKRFRQHDH